MKKVIVFIALFTCVVISYAQQPQQQEQQRPQQQTQQRPPSWAAESTEWYFPEPAKVAPGVGTKPPSDAIILFDGTNLDKWESQRAPAAGERRRAPAPWKIVNGEMRIAPGSGGIQTKEYFGDCQLHVEFKSPPAEKHNGQDRGNSGIFLQNTYEVQVLDGDNNPTYVNGMV